MHVVLWDGSVVVRDRMLYSECEIYSTGSCGGWMLWKAEEPLWYGKKWFTLGGSWGYIAQPYFPSHSVSWLQRQCDQLPHAPVSVTMMAWVPKKKTFLSYVVLLWQKGILMPHLYCSAFCYCNGYLSWSICEEECIILAHSLQGSGLWVFFSVALGLCWGSLSQKSMWPSSLLSEGSCWVTSRNLSLDLAF